MANTLKLDASGVAKLIELNPEFKFELQAAVIAEMTKRLFEGHVSNEFLNVVHELNKKNRNILGQAIQENEDVKKYVDEAYKKLVEQIRSNSYSYSYDKRLAADVKDMIHEEIKSKVRAAVNEHIGTVENQSNICVERIVKRLTPEISGAIEHDVNVKVKKLIDQGVNERLRAIMEGLEG